jgi:hypothetical protein
MPVPDNVVFGPDDLSGSLTYGQVRVLGAEEQFLALQRRLATFLIRQIDELGKEDGGKAKVYSPFPLFLLTCVGIETVGKVFYSRLPNIGEQQEEVQRGAFLRVCGKIHQALCRPLSKIQKENYDGLWGKGGHEKVTNLSHMIYRFGRHTMVHGYRGRGVYLDEGLKEWSFGADGFVLNPYWFWRRFRGVYEDLWKNFHSNREPNNPMRKSAGIYLEELLT